MSGAKAQSSLGTINPSLTSGVQLAAELSTFGAAVQQTNIGPSEPSYTAEGSLWVYNGTANEATLTYTPAHGVSIPLIYINYLTNEAFPVTNGLAATNGNAGEVFEVAYATTSYEAVPLAQAQGLFANNGQNGGNILATGDTILSLTPAESGQVIMANQGGTTATLPSPAAGLNYTIIGNGNANPLTLQTSGGALLDLPDNSTTSSLALVTGSWAGGWRVVCDGANWRCIPFDAPVVPQNTIANRAIPYAQIQSMIAAGATPGFTPQWSDSGIEVFSGNNNQNTISTSLTTGGLGGLAIIVATKSQEQPGTTYTGMNLVVEVGGTTVFNDAQALGNTAVMQWAGSVGANTGVTATLNAQSQYPYLGQVTILFLPQT